MLPSGFTLGLMLGVVVAAALLALKQDAKSLAILGITGGFLAPILAGSNTGSHVDLFSYYLILNVGIVLIAWRKAWRALNLIAFVFTFIMGTLWGVLRYRPEWFATTEPFLIGFYLIFLVTAILFARQQLAAGRHDYVQSTLVFGPPLAVFRGWAALGLMVFLMLWLLNVHFFDIENTNYGSDWVWPLTWRDWPLFNGVDGLTGAIFALLIFLLRDQTLLLTRAMRRYGFWALSLLGFAWLNAMLARSLAVFAGLPLGDASFWMQATTQTTYSIAWSIVSVQPPHL